MNYDKEDHVRFIHDMKKNVLGRDKVKCIEHEIVHKTPKHIRLQSDYELWHHLISRLQCDQLNSISNSKIQRWLYASKQCRKQIKIIQRTLQKVRQEECDNAKNHLLNIGKYGPLVKMNNSKTRSGPVASKFYPTRPREPVKRAINDAQRKEASIITHEWLRLDP
jgi:hypothetical protein